MSTLHGPVTQRGFATWAAGNLVPTPPQAETTRMTDFPALSRRPMNTPSEPTAVCRPGSCSLDSKLYPAGQSFTTSARHDPRVVDGRSGPRHRSRSWIRRPDDAAAGASRSDWLTGASAYGRKRHDRALNSVNAVRIVHRPVHDELPCEPATRCPHGDRSCRVPIVMGVTEHLVGAGEIRDRLGRPSRQLVCQITTDPSFPRPYDELQMGKSGVSKTSRPGSRACRASGRTADCVGVRGASTRRARRLPREGRSRRPGRTPYWSMVILWR